MQRVHMARQVEAERLGDNREATLRILRSQYLALCAEHHPLDVAALRRFEALTGLKIPDAFFK